MIDKTMSQYKILEELGRGAMGFVNKAQELHSGAYLYRIKAGKWQDVKKMVLMK
jgi:hypothetical protein